MLDGLDTLLGAIVTLATVATAIIALKVYGLMRQKHDREEMLRKFPMAPALKLLLDAHAYGEQLEKEQWDSALEIGALRSAGLTNVDFRRLVSRGYVEHAEAYTSPGVDGRGFHMVGKDRFTDASCFILTDSGVAYAKELLETASQWND